MKVGPADGDDVPSSRLLRCAPEVAHLHIYQHNLVDTFPQGGRAPRVPATVNAHGDPWRVPLVLGRRTTAVAEVLFDGQDPDVRINGAPVGHRDILQFDAASGRLRGMFSREFPEPPASFEVAANGTPAVEVSHGDFALGTVTVPEWTVHVVPIHTPDAEGNVEEYVDDYVRWGGLDSLPFAKLHWEVGTPLTSSLSCAEDPEGILRELHDQVDAPPRTTVIGLVDSPNPWCWVDGEWTVNSLAYLGKPYILSLALWGDDFVNAFGHTAGLRDLRSARWGCWSDECSEFGGPVSFEARNGAGLSMTHDTLASASIADGRLARANDHGVAMPEGYFLLPPASHDATPAARTFVDWIEEHFGRRE